MDIDMDMEKDTDMDTDMDMDMDTDIRVLRRDTFSKFFSLTSESRFRTLKNTILTNFKKFHTLD